MLFTMHLIQLNTSYPSKYLFNNLTFSLSVKKRDRNSPMSFRLHSQSHPGLTDIIFKTFSKSVSARFSPRTIKWNHPKIGCFSADLELFQKCTTCKTISLCLFIFIYLLFVYRIYIYLLTHSSV